MNENEFDFIVFHWISPYVKNSYFDDIVSRYVII
jgi:hypothetical protein